MTKRKPILIACERSGEVREAFRAKGFDAWSCDLVPSEIKGQHIVNDVRNILDDGWDMMIAFPPCTYLARSGQRNWKDKQAEQREAIALVDALWNAPIPHIAIENPRGVLSYKRPFMHYQGTGYVWRMYDQLIQPWQFGIPESKATCLWLKNIPPLIYTLIMTIREGRVHREGPSGDRQFRRSKTLTGIAQAMANQWNAIMTG